MGRTKYSSLPLPPLGIVKHTEFDSPIIIENGEKHVMKNCRMMDRLACDSDGDSDYQVGDIVDDEKLKDEFSIVDWDVQGGVHCITSAAARGQGSFGNEAELDFNEDQGFCARHHENRSWDCLKDNGYGTYCCIPSNPCQRIQGASAPVHRRVMTGICSVHKKPRSVAYLRDGRCLPAYECLGIDDPANVRPEVASSSPGTDKVRVRRVLDDNDGKSFYPFVRKSDDDAPEAYEDEEPKLCSFHGKMRAVQSLMDDGKGGFRCQPSWPCLQKEGGICSLHGKKRAGNYLVDDGEGGRKCKREAQCREAEFSNCSVHNKRRAEGNMMDDGKGGMECTPEHPCTVIRRETGTRDLAMDTDVAPLTGFGLCSLHRKKRNASALVDDGTGGKRCIRSSECFKRRWVEESAKSSKSQASGIYSFSGERLDKREASVPEVNPESQNPVIPKTD